MVGDGSGYGTKAPQSRVLTPGREGLPRFRRLARCSTLSFCDALVIEAAADAGCSALLTEDMQCGRKFGGVTVQNPFLWET